MASGHLTHPSWDSDSKRGTTDGTMRNKYDQARAQDMPIIERVHGLAERLGVPMARIALAWHWAKDVTAPIVGCSKTERVDDVIEALGVKLSESDIAYLEEPYTAHELVGPLARPGERALAGTGASTSFCPWLRAAACRRPGSRSGRRWLISLLIGFSTRTASSPPPNSAAEAWSMKL